MPPSADRPPLARMQEAEKILNQFEQGWRSGKPARLEALLPAAGPFAEASARRYLLEELIKIDLFYRWCGGTAEILRLDDYVRRFPDLGPLEELPPPLVAEEYRARSCRGERPPHAEYLARFARQADRLQELLAEIDAELVADERNSPAGKPPAETPIATLASLTQVLRQYQLLPADRLSELLAAGGAADPRAVARDLVRRDWLTPYQVNLLLQGRAHQLVLGPYLLLERLGEGGAGQVYKAQHRLLGRPVALKVIRTELVKDAEAVSRFYREIKVINQLAHPHVVRALDAGPIGGVHVLAMEYVEGVDLARLVKQQGPLPAKQAMEYVRQAALGLQHIHERGLVHRDIKPHNLLLEQPSGAIKILDLGLARLQPSASGPAAASVTSAGTIMMGTVDYMAPEQAIDFRQVDARGDIYSLGCTLYHLLTGQPPFPDGMIAQKLLCHQTKEPEAVERRRRDLPPRLPQVLRRMMAKRPADRFQTAAEVAQALGGSLPRQLLGSRLRNLARCRPSRVVALGLAVLLAVAVIFLTSGSETQPTPPESAPASLYLADWPTADLWSPEPDSFKTGETRAGNNHWRRSLFLHPPTRGSAWVSYRLGKRYRTFVAAVGVDDSVPPRGPAAAGLVFTLQGDGKEIWKSYTFREAGKVQTCRVSVAGVDLLELRVHCNGPNGGALTWWLDPHVGE